MMNKLKRWQEWLPSAVLGVFAWLVLVLVVWLIILVVGLFLGASRAHAGEWFTGGSAYLIVERPWKPTGVCYYKPSDMTSNLGAELIIWETGTRYAKVEWQARLTHHSCAFGRDGRYYNAAGTGIVLRFKR